MSLALRPVLDAHDLARVHERSLDLLDRVGVRYNTPKAFEILEGMGCRVDHGNMSVSLPRTVVEWALQQAPRVVHLFARDPAHDVILDGERPHHTTDSQGTQALDVETGELRDSTAEDLKRGLLFADALDQVEIVNVMVAAGDVPAHSRTVQHLAMAFAHTSKHVRTGVLNAQQVPFITELAKVAAGGQEFRPVFSATDCTISPLMHDGPMTEACIELARMRVPIMVYPMPLAGGTSPVTMGGTVLLHNAEFLSGLVLFQAVSPGTPIIYGTGASQLDLQTGRFACSASGHGMRLALRDLARFYDLPVNLWGFSTASKELDAQYGHEATVQGLLAYLAGADEIYSLGLLGNAQILSLDKMVLDNHLARQIRRIAGPMAMDDEHLQVELIERVGIGGHFLGQRQTRTYARAEYVPPWPPVGEPMLEAVHEEALDILRRHQPSALPAGAGERIADLLTEADRVLNSV